MLCAITLLATGASAFAPATKPAFNLQQQQRASAPLMQFNFFNDDRSDLEKYFDNEKKGKNKRTATKSRKTAKRTGTKSRVRGEFYDDEADTTAKPFWQWDAEQDYERELGPTVAMIEEILRAVEAMHAKSVIHRDLKPANIMLVCSEGHCSGSPCRRSTTTSAASRASRRSRRWGSGGRGVVSELRKARSCFLLW